jgi:transposase
MVDQKGSFMAQIHKQFTADQVKVLLQSYEQGHLTREEIEQTLGIGKTRFFALLKQWRAHPEDFSITYHRQTPARLDPSAEEKIHQELLREKALVENPDLPISGYNYAALTDRLKQAGIEVSPTTIIQRAKALGCYQAKKRKKDRHDRQVLTSAAGELIQHDASLHLWSPFASEKWTLITSLDDYSRMMLYADLVEAETSWAHILAVQFLMQTFGIPLRYYVDNLRVFRFIQNRDNPRVQQVLGTDDVNTQWRTVLALMHTEVSYALSPQAKGKIERPYRWLQDRIVRTCALDHVSSLPQVREILRQEVHRYNYLQVHSTTQEIPAFRFEKAKQDHKSLFRPFQLPAPYGDSKDVFCLRLKRDADGYRKISIGGQAFEIRGIEPRDEVELHLVPDEAKKLVEIRVWAQKKFVHQMRLPIDALGKSVHF